MSWDKKECSTFTWIVQNFGIFLLAEDEPRDGKFDKDYIELNSPIRKTSNEKNVWWLLAYPRGEEIWFELFELQGNLMLDHCEMSVCSSDGEVPLKNIFNWGFSIERSAFKSRQYILPFGTLTLHCRMWGETMKTENFRILSVLKQVNFDWNIENFHFSRSFKKQQVVNSILFDVTLKEDIGSGTYVFEVEAQPGVDGWSSFVEVSMIILECVENIFNDECNTARTRWRVGLAIPDVSASIKLGVESTVAFHKGSTGVSSGSLGEDLLHMYQKGSSLSDVVLHTEGKYFWAHRSILAARSPVFRSMFEKDVDDFSDELQLMFEGFVGNHCLSSHDDRVLDIDDLSSETVGRMLVFLYGGSLEDLQWGDASALYFAADKYGVQPLKEKCSKVLKAGLKLGNVCDTLVLADDHSDENLINCVVDFIREKQEVLSLPEWRKLEQKNPLVTLNIFRKVFVEK